MEFVGRAPRYESLSWRYQRPTFQAGFSSVVFAAMNIGLLSNSPALRKAKHFQTRNAKTSSALRASHHDPSSFALRRCFGYRENFFYFLISRCLSLSVLVSLRDNTYLKTFKRVAPEEPTEQRKRE